MEITPNNLSALFTGFDTVFQRGFEKAPSYYEQIASVVTSTSRQTLYPWLGRTTGFREWIGDRVMQALEAHGFSITNKLFEDTVEIERADIEDDMYGTYSPVIEQLGYDSKTHPDQLIFGMMKAAATGSPVTIGKITIPVPICYDGKALYASDHPVGLAGQTSGVSNINSGGGGSYYWYLVDASRPIRPFLFQMRRNYAVTRMDSMTDERLFMAQAFRYGVDVRCNAGPGLWQLTYASNADLNNPANFAAAVAALRKIKSDAGVPFNSWSGPPTTKFLVVPPDGEEVARQLLHATFGAGAGATPSTAGVPVGNIYLNECTLIVSPWLA